MMGKGKVQGLKTIKVTWNEATG